MKKLLLLVALLLGAWFYQNRSKPVEPAPVQGVEATPAPSLKRYYHSPLDAPPTATGVNTGTGYYSTSPVSSFGTGSRLVDGATPNSRAK